MAAAWLQRNEDHVRSGLVSLVLGAVVWIGAVVFGVEAAPLMGFVVGIVGLAVLEVRNRRQRLALPARAQVRAEECEPEAYLKRTDVERFDVLFRLQIVNLGDEGEFRCEGRWLFDGREIPPPSPGWVFGWEGSDADTHPIGRGGKWRLNVAVFDTGSSMLRPCRPSKNALDTHGTGKLVPHDRGLALGLQIWRVGGDLRPAVLGLEPVEGGEFGMTLRRNSDVLPTPWLLADYQGWIQNDSDD